MKEHNSDFSGCEYIITVAENGYILKFRSHENVFTTFTALVNYLAGSLGTRDIGEELKIISNKESL